jgi:two-component system OmpR family sensor kinase
VAAGPVIVRSPAFTAFHRAESSRSRSTGGTGLGLAIAQGIVERQHGGAIEIDDAPEGGARVKIWLPEAQA